jgi:hypothetical protein
VTVTRADLALAHTELVEIRRPQPRPSTTKLADARSDRPVEASQCVNQTNASAHACEGVAACAEKFGGRWNAKMPERGDRLFQGADRSWPVLLIGNGDLSRLIMDCGSWLANCRRSRDGSLILQNSILAV